MINSLFGGASKQESSGPKSQSPFFILGCVRSGTTMLRDLLRLHPHLECPEETHYFRWSDPFKSPRYLHPYRNNPHIKKQRELDGISEDEFAEILKNATSKRDLNERHAKLFLERRGNPDARWFDKTPQNVYGILLISSQIPEAKFVHIYRNPLNVVASLFEGKVMSISDIYGASNYWIETMQIFEQYKKLAPQRVLEVSYEATTDNPQGEVDRILEFLGEEPLIKVPRGFTHSERNRYREVLSASDMEKVIDLCEPFYSEYGYSREL